MRTPTEQAFLDALFRQYAARLRGHCLRLTASADQADECVQMVFLAAVERAAQLMLHPNPGGWLYVTAVHMVRRLRRQAAQTAGEIPYDQVRDVSPVSAATLVERMEIGIDVRAALAQMSEQERRLYQAVFEQGWDYAHVAAAEGTTVAAIKMRALRWRRKMKKKLES